MVNTEEPAVGSTSEAPAAEPTALPKPPAKAVKATKSASARAGTVSAPAPAGSGDPDREDELDRDDELEAESGGQDRLAELEAENADLKERLAAAGAAVGNPRKPQEPSFGISEGTREELARTGKANSPFTGRKLTKADLPE